jgi:hypothetical protein
MEHGPFSLFYIAIIWECRWDNTTISQVTHLNFCAEPQPPTVILPESYPQPNWSNYIALLFYCSIRPKGQIVLMQGPRGGPQVVGTRPSFNNDPSREGVTPSRVR